VASKRLTVAFTLINPTNVDLVLLNVEPTVPLDGVDLESSTISGGPCGGRGGTLGASPGERVPAGGVVLVTFAFARPESCSHAIRLEAAVISRVFDVSRSGSRYVLPLYADLRDFLNCS
jgi:hypothetical protein